MAKRRNPYRNDPLSEGEMDRRGLTEQPLLRNRDGFRFVKYAGWAVAGVLFLWGFGSYCVNPDAGPAVDNPPNFQEGEFDDVVYDENGNPPRRP
jgi:hypothetical protein